MDTLRDIAARLFLPRFTWVLYNVACLFGMREQCFERLVYRYKEEAQEEVKLVLRALQALQLQGQTVEIIRIPEVSLTIRTEDEEVEFPIDPSTRTMPLSLLPDLRRAAESVYRQVWSEFSVGEVLHA